MMLVQAFRREQGLRVCGVLRLCVESVWQTRSGPPRVARSLAVGARRRRFASRDCAIDCPVARFLNKLAASRSDSALVAALGGPIGWGGALLSVQCTQLQAAVEQGTAWRYHDTLQSAVGGGCTYCISRRYTHQSPPSTARQGATKGSTDWPAAVVPYLGRRRLARKHQERWPHQQRTNAAIIWRPSYRVVACSIVLCSSYTIIFAT